MTAGPIRFLHAGDFHLEQPLEGLLDIPDHLQELFLDAPYTAAERVFDAALSYGVDFLLLAGDLLDVELAGPRGTVFLEDQFRRLAERDIAIYWAGGKVDPPDRWPTALRLPPNVRYFADDRVENLEHTNGGHQSVQVLGLSRPLRGKTNFTQFVGDFQGQPTVAVTHAQVDPEELFPLRIGYFALGGPHAPNIETRGRQVVQSTGTTQGRQRYETGRHGCSLVSLDAAGHFQTTFLPTDRLVWHDLQLEVDSGTTADQLRRQMRQTIENRLAEAHRVDLLLHWQVGGSGPLLGQLRRGPLAQQILERLRDDFGHASPAAWSVSLETEPQNSWPDSYRDQDTLLGDFLQYVERVTRDGSRLDLRPYLPPGCPDQVIQELDQLDDPEHRARILREATSLGVELLTGEAGEP